MASLQYSIFDTNPRVSFGLENNHNVSEKVMGHIKEKLKIIVNDYVAQN